MGIAAHTDFECITFLYQSAPGLEVWNPDGNWLNVPADSGKLIVLFGDMLERWTNGKVQATGHRVRRSQQQRFSIVMFVAAKPGLLVAPLPKFVDPGNPPRFEPVEQASHIAQEVARAKAQMARNTALPWGARSVRCAALRGVPLQNKQSARSSAG